MLAIGAVIAVWPMLQRGVPIGAHDLALHWAYTEELSSAILRGDLYPRWFPALNEGQGSPIFLIQYPLPYYVLAAFHWIGGASQWTIAVFSFLWLYLSGYWCYLWLRDAHGEQAGLFGGAVYMVLPFHLANCTYVRWGIGELCAVAALPLALHCLERRATGAWDWLCPALALSLLLLSHPPTFLLAVPMYFIVVLVRREPRLVKRLAGALLLSLSLCAGYAVRLVLHQPGLMGKQVLDYRSFYVFFDNHVFDLLREGIAWLPAGAALAEKLRSLMVYEPTVRNPAVWPILYSLCCTWLALAVVLVVLTARRRWAAMSVVMLILAGLSTFLTLPWSDVIVRSLPAIERIQLPGRFLVIQSLCAAFLCSAALGGWSTRAGRLALAASVLAILALGNAMMISKVPFGRQVRAARIDTMYVAYGGIPSSLALSRGVGAMQPIPGSTDNRGRPLLNLFCHPGWEVSVAESAWKPPEADPDTRLCVIDRSAAYRLRFEPPLAERIGIAISLASLLSALWWFSRRRVQ